MFRYSQRGYLVEAVQPGEDGKIAGLHVRSLEPGDDRTYLNRAEVLHVMTQNGKGSFVGKGFEVVPFEYGERPFLRLLNLRPEEFSSPEDHLVGLPVSATPSPEVPEPALAPSVKLVYLDQWVWSNLGKLKCGLLQPEMKANCGALLEELRALVAAGKAVCPVSFAHCVELSHYENQEVREEIIGLMIELSRGRCIPMIAIGVTDGVKPQTCKAVDMVPTEGCHYLIDMRGLPSPVALDAVMRLMLSQEAADSGLVEMSRGFIRQMVAALAERSGGASTVSLDPNPTVDVRWADEVFALRMQDPKRRVDQGDPMDLLHLLAAAAADIALLDGRHTTLVTGARHLKFTACRNMEDLREALRHVSSAS